MIKENCNPGFPFASRYKMPANAEFLRREAEFARTHKRYTDEELLQYLRNCAVELGHTPLKKEVPGFTYLKSRLGPWPRVLEKAGLKEPKKKR